MDALHHLTGIRQPRWDFARLQENVAAFDVLIEIHYRYYQFYANTMVALAFGYALWTGAGRGLPLGWPDAAFVVLEAVFFVGSRDTLRKYYARVAQLLGEQQRAHLPAERPESPQQPPITPTPSAEEGPRA